MVPELTTRKSEYCWWWPVDSPPKWPVTNAGNVPMSWRHHSLNIKPVFPGMGSHYKDSMVVRPPYYIYIYIYIYIFYTGKTVSRQPLQPLWRGTRRTGQECSNTTSQLYAWLPCLSEGIRKVIFSPSIGYRHCEGVWISQESNKHTMIFFNVSRPKQNGRKFAIDIFGCISFLIEITIFWFGFHWLYF